MGDENKENLNTERIVILGLTSSIIAWLFDIWLSAAFGIFSNASFEDKIIFLFRETGTKYGIFFALFSIILIIWATVKYKKIDGLTFKVLYWLEVGLIILYFLAIIAFIF